MRTATLFAATCLSALASVGGAYAKTGPASAGADTVAPGDIIVTARKREESLKNVPIAVTAVSGAMLRDEQVNTIKDVSAYSPGLNINSDSAGRSFVSMRGIGTTLIDSVQPGVGIFIDDVYQPNTSYLNSPIVDIERIEVLRGPQGTLFGNNTLGGAINVITRAPGNTWHARIDGAYAGTDDFKSISGSISGPIIKDVLQFRIGAAYHSQDNFQHNSLIGGLRNPLTQKSVNGTLRFAPSPNAVFTVNANFDRVFGGSVPYGWSNGPQDYTLDVGTNVPSFVTIDYKGVSLKGVFDVAPIRTKITAIAAYDRSDANEPTGDADFGPIDFLRASAQRNLKTTTVEARFDTAWSGSVSTLIGVFANHATTHSFGTTTIVPFGLTIPSTVDSVNNSEAVFGTVFAKLSPSLDLAVGLRYDHQRLSATSATTAPAYVMNEVQPRVTLTKRWSPDVMTYASVARGVRGGGQNGPGAPNLIYRGDSVWTYEVGSKFTALDRRLSVDTDVFYNSYSDFIGPNALAPSTSGAGFVAIDLNAGHVNSYGFEAEVNAQVTQRFRLYGNLTLLHARVTDGSEFAASTGYAYPGDRLLFVPDWNFGAGGSYRLPVTDKDAVLFNADVVAKGARTGGSLDAASVPVLNSYYLVNGSIAWQHEGLELAVFATNLFDSKYLESYLDKSLLSRAGLPSFLAQNLSIQGQRRRFGVRASIKF